MSSDDARPEEFSVVLSVSASHENVEKDSEESIDDIDSVHEDISSDTICASSEDVQEPSQESTQDSMVDSHEPTLENESTGEYEPIVESVEPNAQKDELVGGVDTQKFSFPLSTPIFEAVSFDIAQREMHKNLPQSIPESIQGVAQDLDIIGSTEVAGISEEEATSSGEISRGATEPIDRIVFDPREPAAAVVYGAHSPHRNRVIPDADAQGEYAGDKVEIVVDKANILGAVEDASNLFTNPASAHKGNIAVSSEYAAGEDSTGEGNNLRLSDSRRKKWGIFPVTIFSRYWKKISYYWKKKGASFQKSTIIIFLLILIITLISGSVFAYHQFPKVHNKFHSSATDFTFTNAGYAPGIVPLSVNSPHPTYSGLDQKLAPLVVDPNISPVGVMVSDAKTGKKLWSFHDSLLYTPASALKILTATAALLSLPADHTVPTVVVQGENPHTIVLVGGGDSTLSSIDPDKGLYPGSPSMQDLADQVLQHIPAESIDTIVVDQSLFRGTSFPAYWAKGDIADGSISPIVPTIVDGGRVNPKAENSPRYPNPSSVAGKALAKALGVSPQVLIVVGKAPAQSHLLAQVHSAPLVQRLQQMLTMSDNVLAAEIGMEIAAHYDEPLTLENSAQVIAHILDDNGIDIGNSTIVDANGLSYNNKITPQAVMNVLVAASKDDSTLPILHNLWALLPIAGFDGTLADRFEGNNNASYGYIHAKTGTLSSVNSLAGMVVDKDNHPLDFVIISNSTTASSSVVRRKIDSIITALYKCGCH